MKIIQVALDSRESSNYLPHTYSENCVVYTGTQENDTMMGWYHNLCEEDKQFAIDYVNNKYTPKNEIHWDYIKLAYASVASLAIIPMQDCLGLDDSARINIPSTLSGNWTWRMKKEALTKKFANNLNKLVSLYGRN